MKTTQLILSGLILASSTSFADLIFSEYIEGSSYNKALEIMNTGSDSINLSEYSIELYSNGNLSVQNSLMLSGSLDSEKVYVIANASAGTDITAVADITHAVTNFNGNDVLLLKHNGVVVDRIGELGSSDYWGANVTLVRKSSITQGDSAYDLAFDPSIEWDEYEQDTYDYLGDGEIDPPDPIDELVCDDPATLISEIQGASASSPLAGETVTVEAIVTVDLQSSNQMSGFFIQEEDADSDGDSMTSEGLFVYHTNTEVNVGDKVRILATVEEYYGLTELTQVQALAVCSSGNILPEAINYHLPVSQLADFETVENMRIQFNDTMTVNEVYNLSRFGEFMIANGRRAIPTEIAQPGAAADAVAAANDLNALLVEDGIAEQNPSTVPFPAPELDAVNTLRVGDSVDGLTGVIHYAYDAYKLIPTETPIFTPSNARTQAPEVIEDSNFRAASFNVLNYFNGDGNGNGFPTARGATTAFELERQTAKLVAAITALNADVIGLMELENDGFDDLSAIAALTDAINAQLAEPDQYDFVRPDVDQIGTDVLTVGMLYRPATMVPTAQADILSSDNSPLDDQGNPLFIDTLNRPTLIQSFMHRQSSEVITVAVNHLKSKRADACADYQDCEAGQGPYNKVRTNAAIALAEYLNNAVNENILILGDLNAYSKEDPVSALLDANYSLLKQDDGYSYVYDGETGTLDHALVSPGLLAKVLNIQHWNINADEPRALDYNTEYKTEEQILSFYAANAFRSSDHDPAVVDFYMNSKPEAIARIYPFFFWYVFVSESTDKNGEIVDEIWDLGRYQINRPWFVLPRSLLRHEHIKEVTLTVYDNDNASDSVTETIGCVTQHCGRAHHPGNKPPRHHH